MQRYRQEGGKVHFCTGREFLLTFQRMNKLKQSKTDKNKICFCCSFCKWKLKTTRLTVDNFIFWSS